ncbi:MAG TPA: hypothetical protein VNS32_17675 [Flavisolibacter sp.]|nr:hypothetical protein [Flavisolibacter sp.]
MTSNREDQRGKGSGLGNSNDSRAKGGNSKNIEQSVSNKNAYNDDYEVKREDEISQEELKREKGKDEPKRH